MARSERERPQKPSRGGASLRGSLVFACVVAVSIVTPGVRAEEVTVPVGLQAELLAKVAAYDKNFRARAGDVARVLVVVKSGDGDSERSAAVMLRALSGAADVGGLRHQEVLIRWSDAAALATQCRQRSAAIVYLTAGLRDEIPAIARSLDGVDLLTVAAVGDYVPRGAVLGFGVVAGKPKIFVHLAQARRQHVALSAEALKLMKVYE